MPSVTWSTQTELETWAWTNEDTTTTPGSVLVEAGQVLATGTSPNYEAAAWTEWRAVRIPGNRPEGTMYQFRFKTATLVGGLAAATYSDWLDGIDDDGVVLFDLSTWCDNNGAWDVGPFIVLQARLKTS